MECVDGPLQLWLLIYQVEITLSIMRSPIAESGKNGEPTKIITLSREPGNTFRTCEQVIMTCDYQLQPNFIT